MYRRDREGREGRKRKRERREKEGEREKGERQRREREGKERKNNTKGIMHLIHYKSNALLHNNYTQICLQTGKVLFTAIYKRSCKYM